MIENQNDYQKTILDNLPFIAYLKDLNGKIIKEIQNYPNIAVYHRKKWQGLFCHPSLNRLNMKQ